MKHENFEGEILIGQRVHCTLYCGKDGTVVEISGKQSPETCKSMGGFISTGGRACFDIIWDNGTESPKIPESLLRGSVQWRVYSDVVGKDQIAAARANLAITKAKARAEQDAANRSFAEARDRLLTENAARPKAERLKTQEEEENYRKRSISNIRISLKTAFPGVKFSVRQDDGSARVSWTDGPTREEVDAVIRKFKGGHFNGMEDIYEHSESPFNSAFGSVMYLSVSRETSPIVLQKAIDTLWDVLVNVRVLQKPTPETLWKERVVIPNLDNTVSECVAGLASAYNASLGRFVKSNHYGPGYFSIERAIEKQDAELAQEALAGGAK